MNVGRLTYLQQRLHLQSTRIDNQDLRAFRMGIHPSDQRLINYRYELGTRYRLCRSDR